MRPRILYFCLTTFVSVLMGLNALYAIPKYTDKETALALAKVLDKGTFGRYSISSTYVQNDSIKNYYISVILSDGSAHKWYIDQIYKWSRDDKLLLSDNRSLLFLDPQDTGFVVLDKNDFHRLALKANVYIKEYESPDPLAGKKFRYKIKSFNLIAPNETAFGRNHTGSKYRYIIDLFNGMTELLTYEDAYLLIEKKYLLNEKDIVLPTFGRAYHVIKILPKPKGKIEDGVSQFGVEIQFDQPIELTGEHFPFEIYEKRVYDERTKKSQKEFILDVSIPNSEKSFEIRPINSLEYLHNIRIVKNPKYPKRLLMRTSFNPIVMDIPPVIYKNSDNSVFVNFFNLIDQTVLNRGMLLEEKKRKLEEAKSTRTITVKKTIKSDSDYGRAFVAASDVHKEAQSVKEATAKIAKLSESIKKFEEAALFAETDSQLFNALNKRNQLRESMIVLTLEHVGSELKKEGLGGASIKGLMDMLDQAETFTGNKNFLTQIEELREKLIALQR